MSGHAGDLTPEEAWALLESDPDGVLVDVRTDAEWAWVGLTDLSDLDRDPVRIQWSTFPDGARNEGFLDELAAEGLAPEVPVLFLCRSGARSAAAAAAATAAGFARAHNVLGGFEGDPDAHGHRGTMGGWKVAGLPWRQG